MPFLIGLFFEHEKHKIMTSSGELMSHIPPFSNLIVFPLNVADRKFACCKGAEENITIVFCELLTGQIWEINNS